MLTLENLRRLLNAYSYSVISDFPDFARAGVLVPLFPSANGISTLLTKRTDLVDTHKGQIAFPGGMRDKEDVDSIATALRETKEELGIDSSHIEILGTLDELPVPSRFIITPVVGFISQLPPISAHSVEVAEVFEAPLAFFADSSNVWTEEREFQGQKRTVWFYSYNGRVIWGATAAIIRNLLSVLKLLP